MKQIIKNMNNILETTIHELNKNLAQRDILNKFISNNEYKLNTLLKSEHLLQDCQYLVGKFFKRNENFYKVFEVKEFYGKICVYGVCVNPYDIVSFTTELKEVLYNYESISEEEFMYNFNKRANYEKYFKICLNDEF